MTGVFTRDIMRLDVVPAQSTQFIGYVYNIINRHSNSINYDELNSSMILSSEMMFAGTGFALQAVYEPFVHINTSLPENTHTLIQRMDWAEPNAISKWMPHDFGRYLRNGAVNNHMVDPFYTAVLRAPVIAKAMLQQVMAAKLDCGATVVDNRAVYFKLFYNCYARARLALAEQQPHMPIWAAANSSFEICRVDIPAQFSEWLVC